MPAWKVFVVLLLGVLTLGLTLATIIVPLALKGDPNQWVWFGGLLAGTIVMGILLAVFLRHADRTYGK